MCEVIAEVLACGKNMQSSSTKNVTGIAATSGVMSSNAAKASDQAKGAHGLQATEVRDDTAPSSNITAACVKLRRHKRERRSLFDQKCVAILCFGTFR